MENEKWEYCNIYTDGAGRDLVAFFTGEGQKTEIMPSVRGESWQDRFAKKIAALGSEGWEMVGIGDSRQYGLAIYFKRRKRE